VFSPDTVHDTFGEIYGQTGTQQTVFGFTGEETDANSLIYLRARYYSPTLGIFPSLDPVEGATCIPMSLNRYMYAQGNVANAIDPSGMIFELPPTGCDLPLQQRDNCSLTECHARYMAHAAISEAKGVSDSAMAAIILSQLNYFNKNNVFKNLKSIGDFVGVPQDQAYRAYMSRCQRDRSGNFDLGTFSLGSDERSALSLSRAAVLGQCSVGNPLAVFESLQFLGNLLGVKLGLDLNLSQLRNVRDAKMDSEQSFCTSVLDVLPDWRANPQRYDFMLPKAQHYELFRGRQGRSVIVSDNFNPIHINWQCAQRRGAITWAIVGDPNSPAASRTGCKQCDPKTIVWWGVRSRYDFVKDCTGPTFGCD
jgi:RHS repeat-associated protein